MAGWSLEVTWRHIPGIITYANSTQADPDLKTLHFYNVKIGLLDNFCKGFIHGLLTKLSIPSSNTIDA